MIKAVVFDLDDTLYNEMDYVRQGMFQVAVRVAQACMERRVGQRRESEMHLGELGCYQIEMDTIVEVVYERLLQILKQDGRGKIFDTLTAEYGLANAPGCSVPELVKVYRSTKPDLSLYPDAENLLKTLRESRLKLGIITDGCKEVQWAKVTGLHFSDEEQPVRSLFTDIFLTDSMSLSKPDPLVYLHTLKGLGAAPEEAVYIGDNPRKDFLGANAIGMHTIFVDRPEGLGVLRPGEQVPPEALAEYTVQSLTEVPALLVQMSEK